MKIATAPGSWGVEHDCDPANPPWLAVLDEVATIGFDGIELGPIGYFPEQSREIREQLRAHGLRLAGGFVMEPFHRTGVRQATLSRALRTFRLLADAGARHVILIEALVTERARAAGRPDVAPPLDAIGWLTLITTVGRLADLAAQHGLAASFHPHAGTHVEFGPEIERLMTETDPAMLGLCIDTGHTLYAGLDPVELYRRHASRVRHLHLKDVRAGVLATAVTEGLSFEAAVAAGVFCPLGDGDVDLEGFAAALADHGYSGWGTFEQDRLLDDPRARPDAERSLAHLRRISLAGSPAVALERSAP